MKTVVITGASTGIGRATALEFAKTGAKVLLIARSEEKLNQVKEEIKEIGGDAEVFVADLSSSNEIEKLIQDIKLKHPEINILCNIAGVWHGKSEVYAGKNIEDFDTKVVADTLNVGILAPILLSKGLVSLMPTGSSIINLSGTFENGGKGWMPYFVSKRGIEDLTVGLADEYKEKQINVNCVSPSDTATEEYKKFFPEDAEGAQAAEQVAKLFVELSNKDVTGKVFVIKNGSVLEDFHK